MDSIVERAFAAYGVTNATVLDSEAGYRNTSYPARAGDRVVNLIVYKNEPEIATRITRANAVGDHLAKVGLPARSTYDQRILKLSSQSGARYASIYNYLPGTTIPWEGYTKHHIKLLGAAMGKIHAITRSYDLAAPSVADEYIAITKRMSTYFSQDGVKAALRAKLNLAIPDIDCIEILEATKQLPDQRVLHMDLVRGNVLFRKTTGTELSDGPVELCGILDFEKAAFGHPVFDLARTFAFLLVDCKYKSANKIEKYFLHSGYAKRGGGSRYSADQSLLQQLTSMFLLYDFYKFLRHNPYESLLLNEHFVRTRDILIERKLVASL